MILPCKYAPHLESLYLLFHDANVDRAVGTEMNIFPSQNDRKALPNFATRTLSRMSKTCSRRFNSDAFKMKLVLQNQYNKFPLLNNDRIVEQSMNSKDFVTEQRSRQMRRIHHRDVDKPKRKVFSL